MAESNQFALKNPYMWYNNHRTTQALLAYCFKRQPKTRLLLKNPKKPQKQIMFIQLSLP